MATRKKIKALGALLVVAAVVIGFVVLFGSPMGVAGTLIESVPFKLKTKLILSLSIFGFLTLAAAIFSIIWPPKNDWKSELPIVTLLAVLVSFSIGFTYQDCVIFNFCSESQEHPQNCTTSYDRAGAFTNCE